MTAQVDEDAAAATTPWSISLREVSVTYPNGTKALKNVSLDIDAGEVVAIVGLSGSGKSTLIRTINGLVPATAGTVTVGGNTVTGLRGRALRQLRGHIGMIFQGFNLADRTTVLNNVLVGRFAHTPTYRTVLGLTRAADKDLALRALSLGQGPLAAGPGLGGHAGEGLDQGRGALRRAQAAGGHRPRHGPGALDHARL